jgi:hypothetical protein
MEARLVTSPGKAEATERQPIPTLAPLSLLGAFDLTGVMAVAWLALRDDQHTSPAETRGEKRR